MKNKKNNIYKVPLYLSCILVTFDILALIFSSLLSNYFFPFFLSGDDYKISSQIVNYYVFFNTFILVNFYYKGHYQSRLPFWQQIRSILKTIILVIAITGISYYIFELKISLAYVFLNWFIAMAFLILARIISLRIVHKFKGWYLPITILGNNQMVIDCMFAFYGDGQTGFQVETIMLRDKISTPVCLDFIPDGHPPITHINATETNYLDYIKDHQNTYYIIDLEGLRGENRDNLINLLEHNDIDYAIAPPTRRLHLYGMTPLYFFGNDVMILHSHKGAIEPFFLLIKRMIDIFVSACLLPFLAIFTALVYVSKRRNKSVTPIFYGGKRVGKDGQEFKCWKFNTMRKDADKILDDLLASDPKKKKEWDKYQKLNNDPRIDTSFSDLLRRTSLDELPQLWNVFVGDMSLVGSRPILPPQRKEYGQYITLYEEFRPGITGLWQVSGRNETTFEQRIYWDGWYVKNWSLWNDIVILFKTVSVLLTARGAK